MTKASIRQNISKGKLTDEGAVVSKKKTKTMTNKKNMKNMKSKKNMNEEENKKGTVLQVNIKETRMPKKALPTVDDVEVGRLFFIDGDIPCIMTDSDSRSYDALASRQAVVLSGQGAGEILFLHRRKTVTFPVSARLYLKEY